MARVHSLLAYRFAHGSGAPSGCGGGSYVVDDEPSTRHEARDDLLVDLSVELRRLNIGETKRDLLEVSRIVERIAVKGLE